MKKTILTTVIAFFTITFLVIGCSKSGTSTSPSNTDETTLQAKVTQNAEDQTNIQNDDDARANDATAAAETVPGFGLNSVNNNAHFGTFGITDTISIDSTTSKWFIIDKTPFKSKIARIVLRYRGIREALTGYIKKGKITVELINGKKWTDVGAILKETDSVYITFNGKTRFYSGERIVTNVSGGFYNLNQLPNPFVYKIRAYGNVTFEDGTMRTYWIKRINTFTKTSPYTFTIAGDTTVNSNVCTIGGTTRFGDNFLIQAPQAISANAVCGYGKPTAGIRILSYYSEPITITYGVDASGNQVATGDCAKGFKINWTKLNGQQGSVIIDY